MNRPAAALLLALIAGLLGCGSADGDPANVVEKPVPVTAKE